MSSADAKRQVGIKTRALKRLAADVRSYVNEHADHEQSYAAATAAGSTMEAHDVRRRREFVEEAEATLRDVRQRLAENHTQLHRFLGELAVAPEHADLMGDPCIAEARAMLAEVAPLVGQEVAQVAAAAGASGSPVAARITVLGDSQINEDDALWRTSEQLGSALARAGFHIVTGGYSGTSEAVSYGASQLVAAAAASAAAPASITGITAPSAFANTQRGGVSGPNQYSTQQTEASSLLDRATSLVGGSDALVVLPGGIGTLSKLLLAWNDAAVDAWGSAGDSAAPRRVVLAWRDPWESLLTMVSETLRVPSELMQTIQFVSSVEDVIAQLDALKARRDAAQNAGAK